MLRSRNFRASSINLLLESAVHPSYRACMAAGENRKYGENEGIHSLAITWGVGEAGGKGVKSCRDRMSGVHVSSVFVEHLPM